MPEQFMNPEQRQRMTCLAPAAIVEMTTDFEVLHNSPIFDFIVRKYMSDQTTTFHQDTPIILDRFLLPNRIAENLQLPPGSNTVTQMNSYLLVDHELRGDDWRLSSNFMVNDLQYNLAGNSNGTILTIDDPLVRLPSTYELPALASISILGAIAYATSQGNEDRVQTVSYFSEDAISLLENSHMTLANTSGTSVSTKTAIIPYDDIDRALVARQTIVASPKSNGIKLEFFANWLFAGKTFETNSVASDQLFTSSLVSNREFTAGMQQISGEPLDLYNNIPGPDESPRTISPDTDPQEWQNAAVQIMAILNPHLKKASSTLKIVY